MIFDLLNFSIELFIAAIFSVTISASLLGLSNLLSHHYPMIDTWRDYWLVMIILSILPIVYCFIPLQTAAFNVLDLTQLQFIESSLTTTSPLTHWQSDDLPLASFGLLNDMSLLLLTLWIIISSVFIYGFIQQLKKIKSIIKQSTPINQMQQDINAYHYKQLNYLQKTTKVKILLTNATVSPFVFQLRKKYMIIPQAFIEGLSKQQINLIIRHELIHLKKYDPIINICIHLINCIVWFNPLIKVLRHRLNWAIETSCDNEVLLRKPNLRKTYAHLMLKVLRESATKTSNHMVAAFSIKTHKSITMRIINIMKASDQDVKFKYRKTKLYSHALALACITFITQPQLNAAETNSDSSLVNPVKIAKISSAYGAKNKFHKFHKGIDLAAKINTPIIATTSGTVRVSIDEMPNRKNYGTIIIIDHDNGLHSVYAHLNSRVVNKGDTIKAGQLIGYVGETGRATGPHLHLELLKDNKHVNPSDYIDFN